MEVVACLALLTVCLLAVLLAVRERAHDHTLASREAAWTLERRELLNRIQRPDLAPITELPRREPKPPQDASQFARVGSIIRTPQPPRSAA
jgi:hypothetical protein